MKKITYPQGIEVKEGGNHFINWMRINKVEVDFDSEQMRLYRSIWNSACYHAKELPNKIVNDICLVMGERNLNNKILEDIFKAIEKEYKLK